MTELPTNWQLGCDGVKQRGEYLLKSGQWSDCTFLVGAEPDQMVIAGHKLVLATASPVFEFMFYGGMTARNDPIPILDVQPEVFRALVEYIYTDNINVRSFDIEDLYYAAQKYLLPHLVKEIFTQYLWSNLKPRNVCCAYEFAKLFEENEHMDRCIEIISTNTKEVLTDSSFEDIELNTVITVFSLDHLNVDSELDLFEAAVRYAKAQYKRTAERSVSPPSENGPPNEKRSSPGSSTFKDKLANIAGSAENSLEGVMDTQKTSDTSNQSLPGLSDEGKKKPDPKSDKPTIRSAIEKIRFLTLTPQQFAEGPARSSLLTESEALAVLMNIASSSSVAPMPSGFSTSKVPRKQLKVQSENDYEMGSENDLYKKFRDILNKFKTVQNFGTLSDAVKKLDINNQKRLEGVIDLLFEKAVHEPYFSEAYAAMCNKLSVLKVPADNPTSPGKCITFRALLINKCQHYFETRKDEQILNYKSELATCTDPAGKKELLLMIVEETRRVRTRSVGNVKFIGELYKFKILRSKIINYCMKYLVEKDEYEIECLCMLLTTVGEQLQNEVFGEVDDIYKAMQDIVNRKSKKISSRVRSMVREVIELRKRNWEADTAIQLQHKIMHQIQDESAQQRRHIELMNAIPVGGFGRVERDENRRHNSNNSFIDNTWKSSRANHQILQAVTQKMITRLKDNKFEFFEVDSKVSKENEKNLTQTQSKLIQLMRADETLECIKEWIQDNIGKSTNEDWFMRALIQAIFENAIFWPEGRDVPDINQDRMNKYVSLLHEFGETQQSREESCLFGIQQLIRRLEHPPVLTIEIFQYLHEHYIISSDGLCAWMKSKKEPEGKDVMLKALSTFFKNIQEAYNESSCSED